MYANSGVRWQDSDISDDRRPALDSVIAIDKNTHEYMRQMEAVPKLTADGLEGDYRLLSEFNGTVLAGHPTEHGVQFVTCPAEIASASLHRQTTSVSTSLRKV